MHGTDVLVVDDEAVVRQGVTRILTSHGYTVAEAPDARSALDHPALGDCRLVLCDLMLPDGSGLLLLREIRVRHAGLPVVMITGYATPESLAQADQAGVAGLLPKPFDEEELIALVERVLGAEEKEP
jgi:DNA-binding NtrC family response regulator